MGVIVRREKGLRFNGIFALATVSFITTISFALISAVWAIYLNEYVKSMAIVGFLSSFLTIISFFSYFFIIPIIEQKNKSKIYVTSLFLFFISYIFFAVAKSLILVLFLSLAVTILHTLRITSLGIIVKDKSQERKLAKNEGLMYSFTNLAWILGPIIAGFFANNYFAIFVISALFMMTGIIIFKFSKINDANIKKRIDSNIYKNFVDFFREKNRVLAYILGGGVNFWWSLIYLFMPLYLIDSSLGNLNTKWVAVFLFSAAVPLVLFEYKFSEIAGKIGFKKMFHIGFFILFLSALICFFSTDVYLIMIILVIASIGLAMVESTTEAYFFDVITPNEETRFYGPYNTTIDLNHFIGRIFPSIILLFLPFKFIFLFYSLSMLIFFLCSFRVRNIIESKKGKKKK